MSLTTHGMSPLLQVFDMPTSIRYYRDTLGFAVIATSGPGDDYYWAMLRLGTATLMLNTAYDTDQRPSNPDASRVAAHADTCLYFGCENADEVYAHLQAQGCTADQPITSHYGMRQVYTKDPDGFVLCFQHAI